MPDSFSEMGRWIPPEGYENKDEVENDKRINQGDPMHQYTSVENVADDIAPEDERFSLSSKIYPESADVVAAREQVEQERAQRRLTEQGKGSKDFGDEESDVFVDGPGGEAEEVVDQRLGKLTTEERLRREKMNKVMRASPIHQKIRGGVEVHVGARPENKPKDKTEPEHMRLPETDEEDLEEAA